MIHRAYRHVDLTDSKLPLDHRVCTASAVRIEIEDQHRVDPFVEHRLRGDDKPINLIDDGWKLSVKYAASFKTMTSFTRLSPASTVAASASWYVARSFPVDAHEPPRAS